MRQVYLAGPISGLTYGGATDWRKQAVDVLAEAGIEGLDPMRGKDYLADVGVLEGSYEDWPLSTSQGITARDRFDATRCDLLLVNLLGATRVSIGSMLEIAWADSRRTPIVLVMEKEGNPHDHPMIRECAGFITDSLDVGMACCIAILGGRS